MSPSDFLVLSICGGMIGALFVHGFIWWIKQCRTPISSPRRSLFDEYVDHQYPQTSEPSIAMQNMQCLSAEQYQRWQNAHRVWVKPAALEEREIYKIRRILSNGEAKDIENTLAQLKSNPQAWNYFTNQLWTYNSTVIGLMVTHGAVFPLHQTNFDPIVFSTIRHDHVDLVALDALLKAGAPLNDVDVMDNNILDKMLDPEPVARMYHYGSLSWDGVVMELLTRDVDVQDRARQKILQYAQALSEANGERLLAALAARDQRHLKEEVLPSRQLPQTKSKRRM